MNCTEAQAKFDERLDDRLQDSVVAAFDAHLTGCAQCRAEWEAYAGAWQTLARHEPVEPSFGFAARTLRRLEESPVAKTPWFWLPAFRWATLMVAVVAVGLGVWVGEQRATAVKRAELYSEIRNADYLEDFDVIASLDQLSGESNL